MESKGAGAMVFPSLLLVTSVIATLIGAGVTHLLSRVLRLRPTAMSISNPRQQTRFVILVVVVELLLSPYSDMSTDRGRERPLGLAYLTA